MNKSYVILQMYDSLRSGQGIAIKDCCNVYRISVATFRRHIAFLRDYVMEASGREIIYDASLSRYRLK